MSVAARQSAEGVDPLCRRQIYLQWSYPAVASTFDLFRRQTVKKGRTGCLGGDIWRRLHCEHGFGILPGTQNIVWTNLTATHNISPLHEVITSQTCDFYPVTRLSLAGVRTRFAARPKCLLEGPSALELPLILRTHT